MACILTLYDAGPSRFLPAPSRMTQPAVSVPMSARDGAVPSVLASGGGANRVTRFAGLPEPLAVARLMPPAGVAR
jgi:hypothetical protein